MTTTRNWTTENDLALAWFRIQVGTDIWYKNPMRAIYESFEWALGSNIRLLTRETSVGWVPQPPVKLRRAKASGMTRQVTLLTVPDQIVYQALCGEISRRVYPRMSQNYGVCVFSNMIRRPQSRNYWFFRNWKIAYSRFLRVQRRHVLAGKQFVAVLDLASFFDTINHAQLIELLRRFYSVSEELLTVLQRCLLAWSGQEPNNLKGVGIPQGPLASSLLAEAFLHPLDERMKTWAPEVAYARYVDDIRLFADDEEVLTRAVLDLESTLQNMGLVLQSAKFQQGRASEMDQWLREASPAGGHDESATPVQTHEQNVRLRRQFFRCFWRGRFVGTGENIRTARYTLYRLQSESVLTSNVLKLIRTTPVLSDAVHTYLRRTVVQAEYAQKKKIVEEIIDYLSTNPPYDWEAAECLETLALARQRGMLSIGAIRRAVRPFLDEQRQPILRVAAQRWFASLNPWLQRLKEQATNGPDWFTQHQTVLLLSDLHGSSAIANELHALLRQGVPSMAVLAAYISIRDNIHPGDLRQVSPWAGVAFRHYGLIRRAYPPRVVEDVIGRLYHINVPMVPSLRAFLGQRFYKAGARHLLEAEASFYPNPSRFVAQTNNFNQLILTKLLPRYISPSRVKPEAVFGLLANPSNNLNTSVPSIFVSFKECNELRRQSPEPHAYAKDFQDISRQVTPKQRDSLHSKLRAGYQEMLRSI